MQEKKIIRTALDPTPLRINKDMPDFSNDPFFVKQYEEALKLIEEMKVLEHIENKTKNPR